MNGEGFPGFDGGERADGGAPEGLVVGTTEPVPGGAENITDTVEPVPGGAEDITDTVEPVPAGEGVAEEPFVAEESPADWARRTFEGFAGGEKYKAMSVPNEKEGVVSEQGDVFGANSSRAGEITEPGGIEPVERERGPRLTGKDRQKLVGVALEDIPTKEELISCLPLLRKAGLGINELRDALKEREAKPVDYLSDFLNVGFSQEEILGIFAGDTVLNNLGRFVEAGFPIENIVDKVGHHKFVENIETFNDLSVNLGVLDIAGIANNYLDEISDKKVLDRNLNNYEQSKRMARAFLRAKPVLDVLLEKEQSPALSDERIINACFRVYYDFDEGQLLFAKEHGCDPEKLFERYVESARNDSRVERGLPASFWVKKFGLQEEDVIDKLGPKDIAATYREDHEEDYRWLLDYLVARSD